VLDIGQPDKSYSLVVYPDWWCGEWQSKEKAEKARKLNEDQKKWFATARERFKDSPSASALIDSYEHLTNPD
jgi:hypothetical protein